MNLDQAIDLVKKAVKESHLVGQKHVDLSLVDASERAEVEKALMYCQANVAQGVISQEDLKTRLGLNA